MFYLLNDIAMHLTHAWQWKIFIILALVIAGGCVNQFHHTDYRLRGERKLWGIFTWLLLFAGITMLYTALPN